MRRSFFHVLVSGFIALSAVAHADEVVVAVGLSLPPYVIAEERRGIEFDIVKEALAVEGHVMVPRFGPLNQVPRAVESGMADAAMTQRPEINPNAFYSDPHVVYRNFAISLTAHDVQLSRVEDMAGKSVVAFQSASKVLGPAFAAMAQNNPQYREEAKQVAQPILLFLGRVDVVVADQFIFDWYTRDPEVTAKTDATQSVRYHPLFPPTEYRVAFRDKALRDSFNRGLAKLKSSGRYDRIVARYSPAMAGDE